MTLCLAVLGKYVPSLGFFATLLGEEAELDQDIRFYQRLVSLDQDGATAVVEAALKERPRAEVFDQILVPALSRAGRDAARGELEESDMAFVRRVIGEILDDLEGTEDITLKSTARSGEAEPARADGPRRATVRGRGRGGERHLRRPGPADAGADPRPLDVHPRDHRGRRLADAARRPRGGIVPGDGHPVAPASGGPGQARYQVRRLRARFAGLPILVGRWGEAGSDAASEGLSGVGATHVAFTLADARDQILARAASAVPVPAATAG